MVLATQAAGEPTHRRELVLQSGYICSKDCYHIRVLEGAFLLEFPVLGGQIIRLSRALLTLEFQGIYLFP